MRRILHALGYYGGKSAAYSQKIGPWVSSFLPVEPDSLYCELFAGMLGVLLQRPPVKNELVNDTNSDLINWWRVVKNEGEHLAGRLVDVPHSREMFAEAVALLKSDNDSPMDRATAYTIMMVQGINHSATWRRPLVAKRKFRLVQDVPILALKNRLRHVQIENVCALTLLDKIKRLPHAVCYLDPPYEGARSYPYGKHTVDFAALKESLMHNVRARIVISGYGDSYDCLGWTRHEKKVFQSGSQVNTKRNRRRTEVVWMNFNLDDDLPLFSNSGYKRPSSN